MNPLRQLIDPYVIHHYEAKEKKGKLLEVAVYSLDASDIKFRLIYFVDGEMKEFSTTEKSEEALARFNQLIK